MSAINRQRKAVALDEVCLNVAKSSKISLSEAEAKEAIGLLIEICPGFASLRKVEGRDWLMINSRSGNGMSLKECKDELKRILLEGVVD